MSKRILLVDDEPNILLSLEFLMKQAGYEVKTASDGEAALEALDVEPPNLILLDVNMPKRDGFEVCQLVRANPKWENVRIIMLTAKGRDVEREKGLALGADGYITKPFATQEVVDTVRNMLSEDS
jgi:two-component system alkaline phosphatase synthesis response regulator PhoP